MTVVLPRLLHVMLFLIPTARCWRGPEEADGSDGRLDGGRDSGDAPGGGMATFVNSCTFPFSSSMISVSATALIAEAMFDAVATVPLTTPAGM